MRLTRAYLAVKLDSRYTYTHIVTLTPCTVVQVNGEPQKRAEEITAEVAIALTLSQLHPEPGTALSSDTLIWCMQDFSVACTIAKSSKHVPAADHP